MSDDPARDNSAAVFHSAEFQTMTRRQPIQATESDIVTSPRILGARIAQSDDQMHGSSNAGSTKRGGLQAASFLSSFRETERKPLRSVSVFRLGLGTFGTFGDLVTLGTLGSLVDLVFESDDGVRVQLTEGIVRI